MDENDELAEETFEEEAETPNEKTNTPKAGSQAGLLPLEFDD